MSRGHLMGGLMSSGGNPAATFTVTTDAASYVAGTVATVTVTAKAAGGDIAIGYTGTVVITSTDGAAVLPANFTLVNGVGTCSVTLKTVGTTTTITATDSVNGAITGVTASKTVTVAAATQLVITTQPSTTVHAANISPAVVVKIEDAYGNVRTADVLPTVAVTRQIVTGTGVLSGTSPVTPVAGVATFSDLQISLAGTYTLTFAGAGLTSAVSNVFTVS